MNFIKSYIQKIAGEIAENVVEREILNIRGVDKINTQRKSLSSYWGDSMAEMIYGVSKMKYEVDFIKEDTNEERLDMLYKHLGLEIKKINSYKKIVKHK